MDGTTIVIIIDALGFTIAERHGFHPRALPAKARLRTVLGFSQAALASIFTGLMPDEHGLWMMYSFALGRSPLAWLGLVPGRSSMQRLWLRRLVRSYLDRVARVRGYYSLYDVPRDVLCRLDVPARGDIFAPGGAGASRTIFDWLAEQRVPYRVWDYRTEESRAFDELERAAQSGTAAVYLLYTAGLDSELHRSGTLSPDVRSRLAWYEARLERISAAAPDARIVVLGDHGMADVRGSVDLMRAVEALGLDMPRDYVPFYDSTMARFKVRTGRAREALEGLLRAQPRGRILGAGEMIDLGVSFADGRFGDIVFLLDPGIVILPSHMGARLVAAMHGYHPDAGEMSSLMISNAKLPADEMRLTDVASIICPGFEPRRGGDAP